MMSMMMRRMISSMIGYDSDNRLRHQIMMDDGNESDGDDNDVHVE